MTSFSGSTDQEARASDKEVRNDDRVGLRRRWLRIRPARVTHCADGGGPCLRRASAKTHERTPLSQRGHDASWRGQAEGKCGIVFIVLFVFRAELSRTAGFAPIQKAL
jgi:hypothetical protein